VYAEGSAQLNLANTDIRTLIGVISKLTGKNFIIDPRVKGGNVSVITNRELTDDELYDTFLSVLQVHGYAVIETGSVTKVVPANIAKQETHPIIENPKDEPSERLVTRLVPIHNVGSLSIVSALRPLSRNVQIQHHAESNSVVMSGRASDLERLAAIIKKMDRSNEKHIEVVPLKYADAKKVVQTIKGLEQVIKGKIGRAGNKISADERTNSLLVSGDLATRERIRDIIKKLDVPRKTEGKTKVVYLRYAKATDLVKVLQGVSKTAVIANKQGKAKTAKQPISSGGDAGVDIQADDASNSLIITAEPEVLKNLMVVIKKLDVRRAQVMIESIIAEVGTNLSATLGFQFGFNGVGKDGNKDGPIALSTFSSAGANNLINVAGSRSVGSGAVLGFGGTVGGRQFVGLLDALAGDGATNILSTPTLVTMDNEEAEIVVGQNIPLITGSTTSTNGGTSNPFQTIQRQDVGLTLKVKPQINEGTTVRLDISQESSSLAESNAGAADLITNKRSITTSVMVEDGDVLVLGGLIEDKFRDKQEKVPVLGDLPVVGGMFRHNKTSKDKQNLMVFIHPVILRDHLNASVYTKEKYSALRNKQKNSKILRRGAFKNRASTFPKLKDVFTRPGKAKADQTRLEQQKRKQALERQKRLRNKKKWWQRQKIKPVTRRGSNKVPARTTKGRRSVVKPRPPKKNVSEKIPVIDDY
jgi:general secretion pathway protein D